MEPEGEMLNGGQVNDWLFKEGFGKAFGDPSKGVNSCWDRNNSTNCLSTGSTGPYTYLRGIRRLGKW